MRACMKVATASVAAMLLLVSVAHAQIKVAVRVEHPSVLVCENLNAFVTIENHTGGPVVLNEEGGSNIDLKFVVMRDTDKNRPVPRSHDRPLIPRMMARDGETYDGIVDVAHAFDIGGEGNYTIVAEVTWKGRVFRSEPSMVDVVRGIEITSEDVALKDYPDNVRHYSLRYWGRDRYEHLFLAVEEPGTGANLGVFDLGTVIRLFKPSLKVASSGDVLVVHQSGPARYTRTAFRSTLSEIVFVDQIYLREDGSPYVANAPFSEVQGLPSPRKPEKRSWWSRLWTRDDAKDLKPASQPKPK